MPKHRLNFLKTLIHVAIPLLLTSVIFFAKAPPDPALAPPAPAPPCRPDALAAPDDDRLRARHVPILLYHLVSPLDVATSVTAEAFEAQMRLLRDAGYASVSVDALVAAAEGRGMLPERPVAITFDDGWACQYTVAAPILERYGFHATFYLVTGVIGAGRSFLSWAQCRELVAAGHGIGSHSLDHPFLTQLAPAARERELVESKRRLEQALGIEVNTLAYPYGAFDGATVALARKAGYLDAVAVHPGRRQADPCFALERIPVPHGESLDRFRASLGLSRVPASATLGPCAKPSSPASCPS